MSIPYTSYSQLPLFTATTVHSHTEHNTPHQRLIDNDNDLQTQINSLSSVISVGTILQLGQYVFSPTGYSISGNNQAYQFANDTKWSITKINSNSKLLINLDVNWSGSCVHADYRNSYLTCYLRCANADRGEAIELAFTAEAGNNWGMTGGRQQANIWRVVSGLPAGTVYMGYRGTLRLTGSIQNISIYGTINSMTLTYAELIVST